MSPDDRQALREALWAFTRFARGRGNPVCRMTNYEHAQDGYAPLGERPTFARSESIETLIEAFLEEGDTQGPSET